MVIKIVNNYEMLSLMILQVGETPLSLFKQVLPIIQWQKTYIFHHWLPGKLILI